MIYVMVFQPGEVLEAEAYVDYADPIEEVFAAITCSDALISDSRSIGYRGPLEVRFEGDNGTLAVFWVKRGQNKISPGGEKINGFNKRGRKRSI